MGLRLPRSYSRTSRCPTSTPSRATRATSGSSSFSARPALDRYEPWPIPTPDPWSCACRSSRYEKTGWRNDGPVRPVERRWLRLCRRARCNRGRRSGTSPVWAGSPGRCARIRGTAGRYCRGPRRSLPVRHFQPWRAGSSGTPPPGASDAAVEPELRCGHDDLIGPAGPSGSSAPLHDWRSARPAPPSAVGLVPGGQRALSRRAPHRHAFHSTSLLRRSGLLPQHRPTPRSKSPSR
jgi:hypothetical protein